MEQFHEATRVAIGASYHVLPEVYYPLYATFLSIYTDVLGVCEASYLETWSFQRLGFGCLANIKMQSMGWFGL